MTPPRGPIRSRKPWSRSTPAHPRAASQPLPAVTSSTSFLVSWSGTDDADGHPGSGIASYDVFVSDNGGAFTPFQTRTTQTSAPFAGQVGHTYSFYSVATDNVGHVQPTPTSAQATTAARHRTGRHPV